MAETSGLVSAYQVLDYTAERILRHNLAGTGAEEIHVELVSLPDMLKQREGEYTKIRVPPQHEQLAFALLVKRVSIQVLPGPIFGLRLGDLRILDEAGVPYEAIA